MSGLDPTYPSIPVFSFLGFVVALIPLPWMLQSWNVGACAFSIWAALQCLDDFIRLVVWRDNFNNVAPVYCDISSRLQIISTFAIPACSLAINRRLFQITRHNSIGPSKKEKRWSLFVDLSICVFIPLLNLPLYYTIQSNRFGIAEQQGCLAVTTSSLWALFLFFCFPILPSLVSIVYTPFVISAFLKLRRDVKAVTSIGSVSRKHYFRLMALSAFDIIITLPMNTTALIISIIQGQSNGGIPVKEPSWSFVHSEISQVFYIPVEEWRSVTFNRVSFYYTAWGNIAFAFAFLILFGFTEEMRSRYRELFWRCVRPLGLNPKDSTKGGATMSNIKFGSAPNRRRKTTTDFSLASEQPADHDIERQSEVGSEGEVRELKGLALSGDIDEIAVSSVDEISLPDIEAEKA